MKLYTEEQVKEMIEKSRATGLTAEFLTLTTPPIELPSDEEIENKIQDFEPISLEVELGIRTGAKWMRDKLTKTKDK